MSGFLRPEAVAALMRWREVAGAAGFVLLGVWVFGFGGWFYQGLGLLIAAAALAGGVAALWRMRFAADVSQPGIVEIDEGQVRYFGPEGGGFASLRELAEIEILPDRAGQLWWRLHEAGGNVVAIPVAAAGADALFDAFTSLPGLSAATLVAALERRPARRATVWRRRERKALT